MDREIELAAKQCMMDRLDLGEWMQTGEINCTKMVEDTMWELGLNVVYLDDMFEWAYEVATEYEAYLKSVR